MKLGTKRRITDALVSIIAIFLGLIIVFPVVYCILGAFKTPAEFMSPKLLPNSFVFITQDDMREYLDNNSPNSSYVTKNKDVLENI